MSDIVERLRNPMWVHGPATDTNLDAETCVGDMREAADEIERLRMDAASYRSGMQINAEKTKKTPDIDWGKV